MNDNEPTCNRCGSKEIYMTQSYGNQKIHFCEDCVQQGVKKRIAELQGKPIEEKYKHLFFKSSVWVEYEDMGNGAGENIKSTNITFLCKDDYDKFISEFNKLVDGFPDSKEVQTFDYNKEEELPKRSNIHKYHVYRRSDE